MSPSGAIPSPTPGAIAGPTSATPALPQATFCNATAHITLVPLAGRRDFSILDEVVAVSAEAKHDCPTGSLPPSPPTLTWSWRKLPDALWTPVSAQQPRKMELRLPIESELPGPGRYEVRGEDGRTNGTTSIVIPINVDGVPAPVAVLRSSRSASASCDLEMDASGSADTMGSQLRLAWWCDEALASSLSCASAATNATLRIPRGTLSVGSYSFCVNASRQASGTWISAAWSIACTSVQVGSAPIPIVSLAQPPPQVSPQHGFELAATILESTDCRPPEWYAWWLLNESSNVTLLHESRTTADASLVVGALSALPVGQYYRLRILLSESPGAGWTGNQQDSFAFDSEAFWLDAPPREGLCEVSPPEGVASITAFRLVSANWVDDDIPLFHRFARWQPQGGEPQSGSGSWVPLRNWGLSDSVAPVLFSSNSTVRAEARDSLGSVSEALAQVLVRAPTVAPGNEDLVETLNSVVASGDPIVSMAAIASIASVSQQGKYSNASAQVEAVVEFADTLLDTLNQSFSIEDATPETVGASLVALTEVVSVSVVQSPATDAEAPAEKTVDINVASKAVALAIQVFQSSMSTGGVEEVMATDLIGSIASLVVGAAPPASNGTDSGGEQTGEQSASREQQQQLSEQFRNAVAGLGDALVVSKPAGEPVRVEKDGMRLDALKVESGTLIAGGAAVGDFSIPPLAILSGILSAIPDASFVLQNTRWPVNPFRYASGENATSEAASAAYASFDSEGGAAPSRSLSSLSSGEGAESTETEISCCAVDDDAVQSMDVRLKGSNVEVHGLEEPIEFELAAEQVVAARQTSSYDPNLQWEVLQVRQDDIRICQYFNLKTQRWSTEGCWTKEKTAEKLVCQCNHLSSFASAGGKFFSKKGKNNAFLLKEPYKFKVEHLSYPQVHVILVWLCLLYLPLIWTCRKDRDTPWLSERTELFNDKVPRGSTDYLCQCLPPFKVCNGLIMVDATVINCSAHKRRIQKIWSFLMCRKRKSITEAEPEVVDQMFIGLTGAVAQVQQGQGQELDTHLLITSTKPAMRQECFQQVSMLHDMQRGFAEHLRQQYFSTQKQQFHQRRKQASASRKLFRGSLKAVRDVNRMREWKPPAKASADQHAATLHYADVCHRLISHRHASQVKRNSSSGDSDETGSRRVTRLLSLQPPQPRSMHKLCETFNTHLKEHIQHAMSNGMVSSGSVAVPCLPPLHAIHAVIGQVADDEINRPSWFVPGQHAFVWTRQSGQLLVHPAETGRRSVWVLAGGVETLTLHLIEGSNIVVWWNEEATTPVASFQVMTKTCGRVCFNAAEVVRTSMDTLRAWASSQTSPGFLPVGAYQGNEHAVIVRVRLDALGVSVRPRRLLYRSRLRPYRACGIVITAVQKESEAARLGMEVGMELLRVDGECMTNHSFTAVVRMLKRRRLPCQLVFRRPRPPDVLIPLQGMSQDMLSSICQRGMVVTSVKDQTAEVGLQELDEIVEVNGRPCFDALGSQRIARDVLASALRAGTATIGVQRPCGGEVPPCFERLLAMPSVFRYPCAYVLPHIAAMPIRLNLPVENGFAEQLLCAVWMSHGGLVLSVQPFQYNFCIGIYVKDLMAVEEGLESEQCGEWQGELPNEFTDVLQEWTSQGSVSGHNMCDMHRAASDRQPHQLAEVIVPKQSAGGTWQPAQPSDDGADDALWAEITDKSVRNSMRCLSRASPQTLQPHQPRTSKLEVEPSDTQPVSNNGSDVSTRDCERPAPYSFETRQHFGSTDVQLASVQFHSSDQWFAEFCSEVFRPTDRKENGYVVYMHEQGSFKLSRNAEGVWSVTRGGECFLAAADLVRLPFQAKGWLFRDVSGWAEARGLACVDVAAEHPVFASSPSYGSDDAMESAESLGKNPGGPKSRTPDQLPADGGAGAHVPRKGRRRRGAQVSQGQPGKAPRPEKRVSGKGRRRSSQGEKDVQGGQTAEPTACNRGRKPGVKCTKSSLDWIRAHVEDEAQDIMTLENSLFGDKAQDVAEEQHGAAMQSVMCCSNYLRAYRPSARLKTVPSADQPPQLDESRFSSFVNIAQPLSCKREDTSDERPTPGEHATQFAPPLRASMSGLPVVLRLRAEWEEKEGAIVLQCPTAWMQSFLAFRVRRAHEAVYGQLHNMRAAKTRASLQVVRPDNEESQRRMSGMSIPVSECESPELGSPAPEVDVTFADSRSNGDEAPDIRGGVDGSPNARCSGKSHASRESDKSKASLRSQNRISSLPHAETLKEWSRVKRAALEPSHDAAISMSSKQVASKLMYHFMSPQSIAKGLFPTNHPIPGLLTHQAPLTRTERYMILASALNVGSFVATFFFQADCLMVPQPAGCKQGHGYWARWMPTWGTFFASLFGICCAVPTPVLLKTFFRKPPVDEILTESEKKVQIRIWQAKQTVGWILTIGIHTFCIYWLIRFGTYYSMTVFEKWMNASLQGLTHTFLFVPSLRVLVLTLILVASKFFACFDHFLVLFPHVLPPSELEEPEELEEDG